MAEESFRGLAIVAAVAFFVPLLLGFFPRLRLPPVVMEIVVGVIIGPAVLGWVTVDAPSRARRLLFTQNIHARDRLFPFAARNVLF
jgi:Kef-type K+ transport system membrane component KefB